MQASPPSPDRTVRRVPLRKLKTGSNAATFERRADGSIFVRPGSRLGPIPLA